MKHFTGKDSTFEEPIAADNDWVISTDSQTEQESIDELLERIMPLIEQTTEV